MKVSIVVPVYNPGPNLDFCVNSVLAQTLAPDAFELVLVDDGSTDGTAQRLDTLRVQYPEIVRVVHIPNSGWPGRPRNIGIDTSVGEYVQFLDNDDELAPYALEELHNLAVETDADVVIGKMVSDFRGLNHAVFRETVRRKTLADFPFEETLTPHKMFRREFLNTHAIRYAEGPRHLEDQLFVMQAYVNAASISLLGGKPCYFYYRRRGVGRNAGDIWMDPSEYYANLAEVLDVVTTSIPPGEIQDRVLRRFFRVEVLGRLGGAAMARYDDDYRRQLMKAAREVASTWHTTSLSATLPAATRVQLGRLMADDASGLMELAKVNDEVAVRAIVDQPRWQDGTLQLPVSATLHVGSAPLVLEKDGDRHLLPTLVAAGASADDRVLDDPSTADIEISVVARVSAATYALPSHLQLQIAETPDGPVLRITGSARLDPLTAAAGDALVPGIWDLRLRLRYAGWSRSAPLRAVGPGSPVEACLVSPGLAVLPYWTAKTPALALDVGEWAHSLTALVTGDAAGLLSAQIHGRMLELSLGATGPGDLIGAADVIYVPTGHGRRGPVVLEGHVAVRDNRVVVTAPVPRGGVRPSTWQVWLRLGDPGRDTPRPLDVSVAVSPTGSPQVVTYRAPVPWKNSVNGLLRRLTGYQLERPSPSKKPQPRSSDATRLVPAPVFVLSTVRSGSTLLRVMLNSHSQINAPHEMHLRTLRVHIEREYADRSVELLGLNVKELEYLLWDRVLDRELKRSGKSIIVDKTPGNAWAWKRLRECWPDARYIYLLRHPASVAQSLHLAMPERTFDDTVREVASYANGVESARRAMPGFVVRYEDLVADPEGWLRKICDFLGVSYEPAMLEYGDRDHGPYEFGIGDWSDKLRSGRVQQARALPTPDEIPPTLAEIARAWGYVTGSDA